MSIAMAQGVVHLKGNCDAGDVEPLLAAVQQDRSVRIDLTEADHLHTAIFQVLLAFKPVVEGSPRDTFVRTWLIPILRSGLSHRAGQATSRPSSEPECQ